jgi:hypothetical protein
MFLRVPVCGRKLRPVMAFRLGAEAAFSLFSPKTARKSVFLPRGRKRLGAEVHISCVCAQITGQTCFVDIRMGV